MKRWWALGALALAVTAALAIGPKVGDDAPPLTIDPVNDDSEEPFELLEKAAGKPLVVAFLVSNAPANEQLAMALEQGYRELTDAGAQAAMVVPQPGMKGELKSLCDQFGIKTPVAVVDPEDDEVKAWELSEAKDNVLVLIRDGKVEKVFVDSDEGDLETLRAAVEELVL